MSPCRKADDLSMSEFTTCIFSFQVAYISSACRADSLYSGLFAVTTGSPDAEAGSLAGSSAMMTGSPDVEAESLSSGPFAVTTGSPDA